MSNNFQRPPPEMTPFKEKHLRMYTPNSSGGKASLQFNIHNNMPRISIYTNDDSDEKSKEAIEAKMDQMTFFALLETIRRCVASKEPIEYMIANKGYVFFGKQRSEKPEVLSKTIVGKDEEGVVYISVQTKGRPKLRFPFMLGDWHHLLDSQMQPLSKSLASSICAQGWITQMSGMASTYLVTGFKDIPPPEKKSFGGGNNQGGGNKWGNNNRDSGGEKQGYQKPADSSYDDDLPF